MHPSVEEPPMRRRLVPFAAMALLAVAVTAAPAGAQGPQPRVVSETPVSWTPNVLDGTVYAIAVVGEQVVVGGDFHRVASPDGSRTYRRNGLFAFQLGTGTVSDGFAPAVNGPVLALATGPTGTVYAGGGFDTVDGAAHHGAVQLAVANGATVGAFTGGVTGGGVTTLAAANGSLWVGGDFTGAGGAPRAALARLDARTGAPVAGFDAALGVPRTGRLRVQKLALSPDGGTLAVAGTFTQAHGRSRAQLALLSAAGGAVSGWYTAAYTSDCNGTYNTYLRGVDFAPDGSYLVVVTTGDDSGPSNLCDSAARFETAGAGPHQPVWVNRTGGNSLFAVAATGAAVYVGGHELWLDNPYGRKNAGPGAVSRPGIGAIDPATGRALAWNPTRSRGVGVQAMVTFPAGAGHPAGLLVGSDTDQLGHQHHGRIGAFPLT
jgi:hypothetical protein